LFALATIGACSAPPGTPNSPVPNFSNCRDVTAGIPDTNGDGIPDGITWDLRRRNPVGACGGPGEDFSTTLTTVKVGNIREYRLTVTSGPLTEAVYVPTSSQEAISFFDEILFSNGFTMTDPGTAAFRASMKNWIEQNWISPDEFFKKFGV
jgi:hypothetical protein